MLSDDERRERLAYAISEAMRRKKLTPPKVAAAMGKNAETVRRWRDGETIPSLLDALPLAEALGISPFNLVSPNPVPEYHLEDYAVSDENAQAAYDVAQRRLDRLPARLGERLGQRHPDRRRAPVEPDPHVVDGTQDEPLPDE